MLTLTAKFHQLKVHILNPMKYSMVLNMEAVVNVPVVGLIKKDIKV